VAIVAALSAMGPQLAAIFSSIVPYLAQGA
jgi:hypothetical protein